MAKRAVITGVTGQDGSYPAELLLAKGYEVDGIKRRASSFNTQRIDHVYQNPRDENRNFFLHYGDLTDSSNLTRILQETKPDEVYNLAAQSHVAVSFGVPEYTANVDALGTLRPLEGIRLLGLERKTRFYQASTSELYGLVQETPKIESTPFYPRFPYAVAKLFSFWTAVNYREAYGMYACNGILFNHESPRRGETFVTRKITRGLANIALGLEACLFVGNLNALRDWGHARDYVCMQWMILQQDEPRDYVIATGRQISVRDFIRIISRKLGLEVEFRDHGESEHAVVVGREGDLAPCVSLGDTIVRVDGRYFRPTEVETLLGDASKAKRELGWTREISLEEMCQEMIDADLAAARREALLKEHGYEIRLRWNRGAGAIARRHSPKGAHSWSSRHDRCRDTVASRDEGRKGYSRIVTLGSDMTDLSQAQVVEDRLRNRSFDQVCLGVARVGRKLANNTLLADYADH